MGTWNPYLADLMERYHFSVVHVEAQDGGSVPHETFGSERWREVLMILRRDVVCEHCHTSFDYTFRVREESYGSGAQSTSDYAEVTRAVERELRRRVRCPHCREIQITTRRTHLRRTRQHTLVGVATIGGSFLGAITLAGGGYAIGGPWGLALGSAAAIALMLKLAQWMLVEIL